MMDADSLILLAILAYTIAAFVREWFSIDVVALTTMGLLLLFGLVTPQEAISGFSNEAVVTVMMVFILSDALVRSGLVAKVAHRFARLSGETHWPGAIALLVVAGVLSAFINNVAALTIFMPVSIQLARHYRVSPSKLLLPLSYATIFGGACTLVGTSTNLLVSSLSGDYGFAPLTMFELTGLGAILFAVGLVYTVLVPMRTLPARTDEEGLTGKYHLRGFLTEVRVPAGSPLAGRTAMEEKVSQRFNVNVLEILRGKRKIATDLRNTRLAVGDTLIVRGAVEDILSFREQYRLLLLTDLKLTDADLADEENILVEVQLSPTSRLTGATLKQIDFRRRFGCFVLALRRTGELIRDRVALIPLKNWDTLLVFGPRSRVEALGDDFLSLQELEVRLRLSPRWWVSAAVVPAVMVLAALGVMPILKASILGVVVMLVAGGITIQQAYRAINWTVIFLVAAILPIGKAMVNTGLAQRLGEGVAGFGAALGPWAVVALLYLVTMVLTEVMSNNSTAVLMVPIAVSTAAALGVDGKTFLMTVTFASSASFLTPMGYKTNAMVYGPGGYTFMDYIRVGLPLKLIVWVLTVALLPLFWPFAPA
ncbi:MAG TPA: SLC13 family permease [Thermoanaerobaculia bacterium]|jgi:di/tricarboxylate transporter